MSVPDRRRERRLPPQQAASTRWLRMLLRRLAARAVDCAVMTCCAFLAWLPVWMLIALRNPRTTDPLRDADRVNAWVNTNMGWLTAVTVIAVLFGYEAVLLRCTGSTVGKRLMRLQIRRHSDGAALTWPQTVARTLLAVATPVVSQICWISVLWRRDGRGFHDRLLNSAVKERSDSAYLSDISEMSEQRR